MARQGEERRLTVVGHKKLQAEFDFYWKVLRPQTVQRVADAAAEGDRSENAEYIYGRKKLREIDKRLQYLGKLLDAPKVVDPTYMGSERIGFGATVTLKDDSGTIKRWTIVGEGESDPASGTISDASPVAKALAGKTKGDFVEVELPESEIEYEVVDFEYGGDAWKKIVADAADWVFKPTL